MLSSAVDLLKLKIGFDQMRPVGLVGERKAVSLLILSLYTVFFSFLSLLFHSFPENPEVYGFWPAFVGVAACYLLSFLSLASGWFWSRWFAIGLGYAGLSMAVWGMVSLRSIEPVLLFVGLTHGIVVLFLQGQKMVAEFEGKPEWRQRFHVDEETVEKIHQTVTRVATSLPTMIMFVLAPRESEAYLLVASFIGVVVGLSGLLKLRTWGLMVLVASAPFFWVAFFTSRPLMIGTGYALTTAELWNSHFSALGIFAGLVFTGACVHFVRPLVNSLRRS